MTTIRTTISTLSLCLSLAQLPVLGRTIDAENVPGGTVGKEAGSSGPQSILGMGILYLNGKEIAPGCLELTFETGAEKAVATFEVFCSGDGVTWSLVGSVLPKGSNTVYSFTLNPEPSQGPYYKIEQVDMAGERLASEITYARVSQVASGSRLYPNPARESVVVQYKSATTIEICDLAGNTLMTQETVNEEGAVRVDIRLLQAGMYIVKAGGEELRLIRK